MIYTLTLNPAIDYFLSVPDFSTGKVNRTRGEYLLCGGKGINVSVVLKNLGTDNTALGFLAGDTAPLFLSLIEKQGVKTDFITAEKGFTRINVKIKSDAETEINSSGPLPSDDDVKKLIEKLSALNSGDFLVLAGSVPATLPSDIYSQIMSSLEGKNVKIIVDTTGKSLTSCLEYKPYMIKPNHIELGEIYSKTFNSDEEIIECAKDLQARGAQNVLISKGSGGAILVGDDGKIYKSHAPKGEVIGTVGSGDSTVAGFIYASIYGFSKQKTLEFAVSSGSASAFSSSLATGNEIRKVFNENFA